jgi:signal transduction histidine kinase
MPHEDAARRDLLDTLLDLRSVFDPRSALTLTLQKALEGDHRESAVSWVAVPDPRGGLVIEHVLGQRTTALERLDIAAGQGLTGRVYVDAAIHWVEEYAQAATISHEFDQIIEAERLRRLIAAPLVIDEQVLGVLTVGRRDPGPFADRTLAHVEQLAKGASFALAVARKSRDQAVAAALAERRRISEEIHDGVSALLFTIASRTEKVQRRTVDQDLAREIGTLRDEVAQVSGLVRELITGWHASATHDVRAQVQGLVDDFVRRTGTDAVAVFLGPAPDLPPARVEALSRFVAVALANVERHASAEHVSVTVARLPDQVTVAVSNDGPAPIGVEPGIGLTGAGARIAVVGGEMTFLADGLEEGFTVRARLPL